MKPSCRTTVPALGFALVFALAGCREKINVNVLCTTTAAPAVECEVIQTEGKAEVDVCWDFAAVCENGAVVEAERTCQKIKDGGTTKVTIAADKLRGLEACGGSTPPQARLTNLTLDGKPSESR